MPNPTRRDMHVSAPLANLTIAAMNEDSDFVLKEACSFQQVEKQTNKYFVYGVGDWNRIEMQPRGSSQRSEKGGWSLSTTEYNCRRESLSVPEDWYDVDEADEAIDADMDAADYLANQAKLRGEQLFSAEIFIAATWTTDFDGAAAKDYASSEVLYWDNASADPQEDHLYLSGVVKALCGKTPNVMVVGYDVHVALLTSAVVRDAIKHTEFTGPQEVYAKMARFFGVDKYLVAGAFYNSAAEGATDSFGFLVASDSVWAGYIDPREGKKVYTACKTFAYNARGEAADGVVARKWDQQNETSTYHEVDTFWDVKIVAADAGYFIDDVMT